MAMDVEAEIRDLKRRVNELEGSFGFLTEQVKGVHKDLLRFEEKTDARFDRVDERFDTLDGKVDQLDRKVDRLDGPWTMSIPACAASHRHAEKRRRHHARGHAGATGQIVTRPRVEFIHEGQYAAEVEIELHRATTPLVADLSGEDARSLKPSRLALRARDVAEAAKYGRVFELTPVTAK